MSVPTTDSSVAAGRCSTCRHWDQKTPQSDWRVDIRLTLRPGENEDDRYSTDGPLQQRVRAIEARYGLCQVITLLDTYDTIDENEVPIAFCRDGSDYMANLYTRDDFGCTLWEAPDGA